VQRLANPGARRQGEEAPSRAALALHRRLPGYAPTPLRDVPALAREIGVESVLVKDESKRLGLPAFKIMGASWAVMRALEARRGSFAPWERLEDLARQLEGSGLVLVAATDGNHGRAVARMATRLGLAATILVPSDMVAARRAAIASEGAEVVVVDGSYDDAVRASAEACADGGRVLVSDTSWPGYESIPAAVVEGYATILWEIEDALAATRAPGPDTVLVQVGVGAFAAAVARHYRRPGAAQPPRLVSVEPTGAACALASLAAGEIVSLAEPPHSIMAGLNCGTPSLVAWPVLVAGVDLFCAVEDERAREGMRALARAGIRAGECSGGAVGAALGLWEAGELGPRSRVLLFLTEGVTDPAGYERVIGREGPS